MKPRYFKLRPVTFFLFLQGLLTSVTDLSAMLCTFPQERMFAMPFYSVLILVLP